MAAPIEQVRITRRAPAKINLALAVEPRDGQSGLHPICSWFAAIDLVDELTVTRLKPDRFSRYAIVWHDEALVTSTIDWSITKDLAVRAHRRLEEEVARSLPVQMKLEKRIPVGGGLGGGSSNAAAMLLATRELFDLDIDDATLVRIALELGSDVPFFLGENSAVISGIGDEISGAAMPVGAIVLIAPGVACSTAEVYRAYDDGPAEARDTAQVIALSQRACVDPSALFNDLSEPAMRVAPELRTVRDTVQRLVDQPVHITGSGSAMFIVCPSGLSQAKPLAKILSGELGDCGICAVRFLG